MISFARLLALLAATLIVASSAYAYPNGAPWGSANPAVEPNCSSCHFDGEAIVESKALTISGLPQTLTGGKDYEIKLQVNRQTDSPANGPTGFLGSASAGAFSTDNPDLEAMGQELRSISPSHAAAAEWKFNWTAPELQSGPVIFHIGVNAANDDASPFGDEIHFRTFEVPAKP